MNIPEELEQVIEVLRKGELTDEIGHYLTRFGDLIVQEEYWGNGNAGNYLVRLGQVRPDLLYDARLAIREALTL